MTEMAHKKAQTPIFIDSFCVGQFRMKNPTGSQIIFFEDSDQFGPSLFNLRTEEPSPIAEKHWFWRWYPQWVEAGRPTTGQTLISRFGLTIEFCEVKQ